MNDLGEMHWRSQWRAILDEFQATLDKFEVPATEQAELKAIVNITKADIVVGGE